MKLNVLLGSKSPRRHQIFTEAGWKFQTVHCEVDEVFPSKLSAEKVPEYLSSIKSQAYAALQPNEILITADTIVYFNGEILGKPANADEAQSMLEKLSGHTHLVYTGVTLRSVHQTVGFTEKSEVSFYPILKEDLWEYIHHHHPYDKAGAYGIQDFMGYRSVRSINGCYYNVMGFPMATFIRKFRAFIL